MAKSKPIGLQSRNLPSKRVFKPVPPAPKPINSIDRARQEIQHLVNPNFWTSGTPTPVNKLATSPTPEAIVKAINIFGQAAKQMLSGQVPPGQTLAIGYPSTYQNQLETAVYGDTLANIGKTMNYTQQQQTFGAIIASTNYVTYNYYAVFSDGSKSFIGSGTSSVWVGTRIGDPVKGMAVSYLAVDASAAQPFLGPNPVSQSQPSPSTSISPSGGRVFF